MSKISNNKSIESEERFRLLVEIISNWIWEVDKNAVYTYISPKVKDLLGYEPGDIIGKTPFDLMATNEAERVRKIFYTIIESQKPFARLENIKLHKNGRLIVLETSGVPIFNNYGDFIGYWGISCNISKRKWVEEEFKNKNKQFISVMNSLNAVVYVADFKNYELLFMNDYLRNIFGDHIGEPCWKVLQTDQTGPCSFCSNDQLLDVDGNPKGVYIWEFQNTLNQKWYECRDQAIQWPDGRLVRMEIAIDITKRKKAQQKLKESEKKYRFLFDNAIDGILLGDTITRKFYTGNKAICEMLGYTLEEIKKLEVEDIHPKDKLPFVLEQFEKQARGEFTLAKNIPVKRKDGTIFYADINSTPMELEGRKYLMGMFRDITTRLDAEKKLEEEQKKRITFLGSMDRINKAIQSAANLEEMMINVLNEVLSIFNSDRAWLVYPCDLKSQTWRVPMEITVPEYPGLFSLNEEITYTKADREIAQVLLNSDDPVAYGPSPEHELPPQELWERFSIKSQLLTDFQPKIGLPWIFGIHQCSYPHVWSQEEKRIFKEISYRIADSLGSWLYLQKLKESEKELKRSDTENRAILSANPDLIFEFDKDGIYTLVKGNTNDLYLPPDELLGKKITDLLPKDIALLAIEKINKTLQTGETQIFEYELTIAGEQRYWEARMVISRKDRVMTVIREITYRKKAEQALKKSEGTYREAFDRAEFYKDLFAHDINNILQGIMSANQLIDIFQSSPKDQQKTNELLIMIKEQVERGARLVQNVRKLSQLEEHEIISEKTEIVSILNKSINLVKNRYQEKHFKIQIDSIYEKLYVQANELIQDVFENILINSAQHNNNPTIDITIKISKIKYNSKNYNKLEFIDNGTGIEDDRKDAIFKRSVKNKVGVRGMGLGLSLIKKIIDSYNGKVWVEDKVKGDFSKGSNFIFLIPDLI